MMMTVHVKESENGRLVRFERGQIVDACLVGAFVTKTAPLLGASRATVSEVMSAYTSHGKTTSAKRNSGRKSTLTERDRRTLRRILSKRHRTTVPHDTTADLNIYLEDPVSTKKVRRNFFVFTLAPYSVARSHIGAQG
jgi:transposase